MQKKSLMFIALAFFVGSAHAKDETVEFSVVTEKISATGTALIGSPVVIQQGGDNKMSAMCTFKHDLAGTPIKSTYGLDTSTVMTTTVLPIERTTTGIKAFIAISKQSAQGQDWAVINKDCKLPVGTTNSTGISLLDNFDWGKPTKLKLSDGSSVVVTISPSAL